MKYFQKLIVLILGLLFCSVIVQAERMKISPNNLMNENKVVKNSAALNAITEDNFGDNKLLLIYGKSDRDISCKETMAKNLEHMKVDFDCIEVEKLNTKNIEDFKDVILIVTDINNRISDDIYKIFDYVNKGGNLLWAGMPEDISETFNSVYRKLGIKEMSGYSHIEGLHFFEEVVPGIKDRTFIDESVFKDSCINVRLDSSCKIIIESAGTEEKTPILWQRDYGKGKCIFYNGTSLGEKSYCGIFAGTVAILSDDFMYPIINAKVVFIDDFPSPQYDSTSNIIEKYYNRTIKEFYRDVWWPDMNSAAKKNNV
ncbi:MAG: DUF2194 domain-containing protein, partial [Clostridium sp.]|nr:DUF2194 domain-containing protein [Clostridium sp.]